MFSLHLVYDEIHRLHRDPNNYHPERPERIDLAMNSLRSSDVWGGIIVRETYEPEPEILKEIHDPQYISLIKRLSEKTISYIDPDTYVSHRTYEVALRFTTTAWRVAEELLRERGIWFILSRPPGHHAGRYGVAMNAPTQGFCIFNHAAAAALAVVRRGGKVAIIDFDAHHGNGTQEILWEEPGALHIDIHQEGIYPGTGDVEDIGGRGAEGTKINIPLEAGSGDEIYRWVLENVVKELIDRFRPDVIIVSAGFDAYRGEPITYLGATEKTYALYGSYLSELYSEERVRGVVAILEGGYDVGLRLGLRAFVEGLVGARKEVYVGVREPPDELKKRLSEILREYWGFELG